MTSLKHFQHHYYSITMPSHYEIILGHKALSSHRYQPSIAFAYNSNQPLSTIIQLTRLIHHSADNKPLETMSTHRKSSLTHYELPFCNHPRYGPEPTENINHQYPISSTIIKMKPLSTTIQSPNCSHESFTTI